MFTATILVLVSGGLDGAAIDPCSGITAPPIVIHEIHAAPIEIAVTWHAPAEGDAALQPPLEALGDFCDGQGRLGPRHLQAGETIARGTLNNLGDSTIFILSAEGELIQIPSGQSLWVGDDGGLTPTHRCMCICTCSGGGFSETITSRCNGLGGCARNGEVCEILDEYGKLRTGTISNCTVVYSPIPNPVLL
jgi:hypothetical protein